jgi:hypothetical protein
MATVFNSKTSSPTNKIGTFESVISGIGSGFIQIPKGLFSLGATLLDLGVDSGKAAKVEQWFDDLTELDEKAEATAAGKITELLVNIGIPGGVGFKVAGGMAKKAMLAKKSGKYLEPANKSLQKGIQQAQALNTRGRTNQFIVGALGGGLAEGVFVGDIEKTGSLGDLIGGPTKIDRGEGEDAVRDLLNRVKFGTEGALFTGVIGGVGSTIKRLAGRGRKLDIANSKIDRLIDKAAGKFRARSDKTPEMFEIERASTGMRGSDTVLAKNISRDTDKFIDSIFPPLRTIWNKQKAGERDVLLKEINDLLLSGDPKLVDEVIDGAPTGRMVSQWGKMNQPKLEALTEKLVGLGAKNDDITSMVAGLGRVRQRWDDLFTAIGRNLDPEEMKAFKDAFGTKFKDYLGATYDVMQNKSMIPWLRYRPTEEVIGEAKDIFKNTYDNIPANKQAGKTLSDAEAEQSIQRILDTAELPKGMRMDKPSDPYFAIPEFMAGDPRFFASKTVYDDVVAGMGRRGRPTANIAQLAEEFRPTFEKLLGKQRNPMQTILAGMSKLSLVAQRNIFFRNIFDKNEELLTKAAKEVEQTGKTDIMPMFARSESEARSFFGNDYRAINVIDEAQKGRVGLSSGASNPFGQRGTTYYARPGLAEALETQGINSKGFTLMGSEILGDMYTGLLLYPKATSQIAKTILSPITHMRNFISAGAFAAANGIIPANFGKVNVTVAGKELVENPMKLAYQALQTGLKGTRQQNDLYDKLIKLGVVNSNVRLGDLSRLLEDINFGATMSYQKGMKGLMKQMSKIKSIGQDLYTAEDDFWKIYSWAIEKARLTRALEKQGVTRGTKDAWIKNAKGESIEVTEDWLEREAADIVKNNIPNYDYVPDFIKGLRKLPVGNFVSFPAEIARTGANIVQRALREINTTFTLANGKVIKPFQGIGYTRLFGFTTTVAAVPYATQKMFQTIYDVTDDEREAIRRYVAKWSKNSTILPMKDENGDFKYIDFSHANAYDTLIRPLQTVVNAVADGQAEDGIMDDFMKGMFDSMKEFGEPFISESIWTEAAFDIILRGGRSREGYQIYNQEDSAGNKATAIFDHLVKAQMPFSFDQFKRLDKSIKEVDVITKGKYDDYGQEFEFGDEFSGLFGFRAVKLNPERTIKFKVADYKKGVRDSGSLFTRETLKGGPIEPREIVEAYINANRALFNVKKNFMQDLDAAQILGISQEAYDANVDISSRERSAIEEGVFRPYTPSMNIRQAFAENAAKIGMPDPFERAVNVIDSIRDQLSNLSLNAAEFPVINNPLMPSIMDQQTLPNINTGTPLNLPSVSANVVGAQTGNIPYNQMTSQQKLNILFGKG